jgi:hypothetical protein
MLLILCILSGCDRHAAVEEGLYGSSAATVYAPDPGGNGEKERSPGEWLSTVRSVLVDRDHQIAWFRLEDAAVSLIPFKPWPQSECPEGCPTNINATRMEVLELDTDALVLSPTLEAGWLLMRECPPDPVRLALRRDGAFGTSACVGVERCRRFAQASRDLSLPRSSKGYELYSWRADGEAGWAYALITGTNRDKTWDEVSAPGGTLTDEGGVRIRAEGEAALKSVLRPLPEGANVLWMSSEVPQVGADLGEHLGLPPPAIIREIRIYSQKQGLNLWVGDRGE